jgi:putative membrane protein
VSPEVDSRTLQANERTLLAWLRTGISLITFGFVIAKLGVWMDLQHDSGRRIPRAPWVGGLFVLLGAFTDVVGIVRYLSFRRSLIGFQPTPLGQAMVMVVAVSVSLLGAVLGALVMANMFR